MKYFLSISFSFVFSFAYSQSSFPQNYFRSPLDIPLYLSGNFGELRNNHFHAGLDIKTQGTIGAKVYAVADGYVSRIRVSPYGYGNALYISHPNGYTSVYAHLEKYSDKIATVVKNTQYREESFDVQLFPGANQINVKKGELVAYSGNTGGSAGPHLHFEIRDTKTEHPYNPLLFGFDVKDNRKAEIKSVKIYPLNDTSLINGSNQPKHFTAVGSNGNYRLNSSYPILLNGIYGFGIESIDRMNGQHNSYGLHNIKLWKDSSLIFEQEINEFAFREGRYLNALIDYPYYIQRRRRIQRSYRLPGNRLRFYKTLVNNGKVVITEGEKVEMRYEVSDFEGNTSRIAFTVTGKSTRSQSTQASVGAQKVRLFPYNEKNTFIQEDLLVVLPKGVLYEDLLFAYRKDDKNPKTIGPIYWIHDHYTPLHSYMTISIKQRGLSLKEKSQAIIVSTTNGSNFYGEGGKWNGDNISVKTRSFGGYGIAIDSIPPKITPINIYPGADMSNKWSISIKITDNLSHIDTYRAEINGKWILMEYDAKNDMLYHYFDERTKTGTHHFKITVSDGVGNTSTYEASFKR